MKMKKLAPVLCAFIVVYVFFAVSTYIVSQNRFEETVDATLDWEIFVDERPIGSIKNFYQTFANDVEINQGDVITYKTTLHNVSDYRFPAIFIKERYCAYEVFYNGEKIAQRYMNDLDEESTFVGMEQRVISIPNDATDGEITLKLYVLEKAHITGLEQGWFGDYNSLKMAFFHRYNIGYITGMFMIFFGGIYLFLSFILTPQFSYMHKYIPLGLLAVELGVMILSKYGLTFLFMDNRVSASSYDCSLFALIPLGIWTGHSILGRAKDVLVRQVEWIVLVLGLGLLAGRILNLYCLPQVSVFYALLALVMFGLLFVRVHYYLKKQKKEVGQNVLNMAICICSVCMLITYTVSGFRYMGWIRLGEVGDLTELAMMCVGPMFFAYFLLMDFLHHISKVYAKEQEYDSLVRLAYEDGLTRMPNRGSWNLYMKKMEKKKTDYCIISMDVNGLKPINDSFGHNMGDCLLTTFSDVLKKVYENDFYARIGGDEFVIVLEDATDDMVAESLEEVDTELDWLNALGEVPFSYSVSSGYAYRHEVDEDFPHQTYLLADQRMYQEKQKYHGSAVKKQEI